MICFPIILNLEREDILEALRYAAWRLREHEVDLADAS